MAVATVALVTVGSLTASAQVYGSFGGGGTDYHTVITIHADGSSQAVTTYIMTRKMIEQEMRMTEQYKKMSENNDDDSDNATNKPAVTATNEVKELTDDELTKKYTDLLNERQDDDADQKYNVQVNQDKVTAVKSSSFQSLEELLRQGYALWGENGVQFENIKLETDTNGLLRMTFFPQENMGRYLKTFRSSWKLSGTKSELKLIFPGKVVSSDLTGMDTNSTWLITDGKDDSSLDKVVKLYAGPTIITAESGGLKLEQPLESKNLWRSARQTSGPNKDIPITDAGPGYVAEAQSITTTTLHVFPEGGEYFKHSPESTGAVVNVKFYAPKDRTLKSVSDIRVVSAVDNKGRAIAPATASDDEESTEIEESNEGNLNGSTKSTAIQIQLRLQLPQPDAQSIDKISAEAVALTIGSWKEMNLTNLQANATNEIDLAEVLPGTKMVIEKLSAKDRQYSLEAKLTGPAAIQNLEVNLSLPGNDQFNSNSFDRSTRVTGKQATRTIQITGFTFTEGNDSSTNSLLLKVRFPQDLQRSRVKFDLKGLDLL